MSKQFLGFGRARDYTAPEGHELVEEGRRVYAYPSDFFCTRCEGCGCKSCKWTGEEAVAARLRAARRRGRAARKAARERVRRAS
jgi:hypothetical protein